MNKFMRLHDLVSKSDMLCDLTPISSEGVDVCQDGIVCVMQKFYCVSKRVFRV